LPARLCRACPFGVKGNSPELTEGVRGFDFKNKIVFVHKNSLSQNKTVDKYITYMLLSFYENFK